MARRFSAFADDGSRLVCVFCACDGSRLGWLRSRRRLNALDLGSREGRG